MYAKELELMCSFPTTSLPTSSDELKSKDFARSRLSSTTIRFVLLCIYTTAAGEHRNVIDDWTLTSETSHIQKIHGHLE